MTSNISTPSSSRDSSTDSQEENNDTNNVNDNKESNLCPFKLLWSFGINTKVPVINLTTENRSIIAYASSHAIVIYNYESNEVINLQGHQNEVRTISVSTNGKWLMSAAFKKGSVVIVWDTETGVPICTLFNPHGDYEMTAAKISPNAKYIVTVGNEMYQKVYFWLWTYGKDEPDGVVELTEIISNTVKDIAFNEDIPEEFLLTADSNVVFCNWENNELKCYYPRVLGKTRRYGTFNCSCYVSKTHRVLTATSHGYVLLWDIDVDTESDSSNGTEKRHIKSVQLEQCSITVILNHDGLIVVGTAENRICFYDIDLKILYSCNNLHLDSIQSISFESSTSLLGPVSIVSKSEIDFSEDDQVEYEGTFEKSSETKLDGPICREKMAYLNKIESINLDKVSSTLTVNLENTLRNHNKNRETIAKSVVPTDATLNSAPFYISNFTVSSSNGSIALINISTLKCQFIFQYLSGAITSLDAHPRCDFLITGDVNGLMCLYDYTKRKTILRRTTPPLPDFRLVLEHQMKWDSIIYTTCPQNNDKLTAITVLKFSPSGDLIACGLENGTLWMLHPLTLDPIDAIPYKHSSEAISKLIFTECAEYMAYSDNTFVVAVFKRNCELHLGSHTWNFLGKYRTHQGIIRDLLFGPATSANNTPRLFSVGEDRHLIEYDLKNSGPYPDPGLKIAEAYQIETTATPLCLTWYPQLGVERFLIISNSEYKYRLLNDVNKAIRGTFLGPLFDSPVRYLKELPTKEIKGGGYMVFATEKEIGLQMYPIDGNPYKILGIIGHPCKINNICINWDGNILFTSGHNDTCALMWKIKCRSVDVLAQLGGEGLSPYYCLIEGGKNGWLLKEITDFFYYAQILHQGEYTTVTRIVSEKVVTNQITNLMRAIGYYPSNAEIEILMGEISYRNYADTGQLVEEITFEDFVKLYINHRPAFGISMGQLEEAFQVFTNGHHDSSTEDQDHSVLTREQFLRALFGEGPIGCEREKQKLFGEPLPPQEAFVYLKFLTYPDDYLEEMYRDLDIHSITVEYSFLPQRISYKDFITDILGIESPEETRADDD